MQSETQKANAMQHGKPIPADSWKGEHLIRNITTEADKASEVRRLVNKIYHNNRRKQKAPAPGAKQHGELMKRVLAEITR